MANAKDPVSPYIGNIRNWKIREIISGYFEALIHYKEFYRPFGKIDKMPFSTLRKICDILYDAKENFHLIFKRVMNPKKKIFEQASKFVPSELEISFMNNIGILFHRVMIARELKYMMDYYEEETENYEEAKGSLVTNLKKIDILFDQGIEIILQLLEDYHDNILLLTYFMENIELLKSVANIKPEKIISTFISDKKIEDIYIAAGKYYLESGWQDKSRTLLKEFIRNIPDKKEALAILKNIKGN